MKLTVELPYTLYNRLAELRDTYGYQDDDEAIIACISSAYVDYLIKGDNLKGYSFYLPIEFVNQPRFGKYGLIDQLAQDTYRKTGDILRETIEKALENREQVDLLLLECPNGYYNNAQKKNFPVNMNAHIHTQFRKLCEEQLKQGMSRVLTGLLYYRLKMKGLLKNED
jgi:predicted DNA-binding protein